MICNQLQTKEGVLDEHDVTEMNLIERPRCEALDKILGNPFPMLDHGFVRVIDYLGDDSAIVQAARVSYGTGTKSTSEDRGLINYLMRHRHTTPFEMCEIKFHVKLPIFVARQWVRHRTANINEYSARYSILDKEFYIPEAEQLCLQSVANKQGRSEAVQEAHALSANIAINRSAESAYSAYEYLLSMGVARELARMVLPVNYYTQWYWKVDLHNLFNFLSLRVDPHAQYEIRVYAEKMLEIVKLWCPLAYEAFVEHRLNAFTFSATGLKFISECLKWPSRNRDEVKQEVGLGDREFKEICEVTARQ